MNLDSHGQHPQLNNSMELLVVTDTTLFASKILQMIYNSVLILTKLVLIVLTSKQYNFGSNLMILAHICLKI
jgi:hypothetical protein